MEIVKLLLSMFLPMLAFQAAYRLWDRNGEHTAGLADRFPFLVKHKFWVQILAPLFCIVVIGVICAGAGLGAYVFFPVSGALVGAVNGMAVTLMALEDLRAEDIVEEDDDPPPEVRG